ncbi:helix-turn-helix transcriptional regulator [Peribacillus tepidiphilus]|uniref:helix-turn-helix transcriptional regulator n=1 Tax=Peribacillus tepidiphilus TaxID=2652445 RepID=UPI0012926F9D|nr:helix-turn-helix transcriptional regulator [Peribacillus tepidiphilus]
MIKLNLEFIRGIRKSHNLSQEEMAKKLGFNTVYPYHRKETGQQPFTAEEIFTLATLFNEPYEKFFCDSSCEK